jgi:predicted unusual protein kinase regulating ubiquinone biosynthesis (AarF/ABC1/UbiB family)
MLTWLLAALLAAVLLAWVLLGRAAAKRNGAGLTTTLSARGSQIGRLAARTMLRRVWFSVRTALSTRERRRKLRERYHMQVAEEATEMMGNMKGAFMKLGQILSFATEVVPENARQALAKLQMDAPPMSFAIVRSVIEQDFGADLSALFRRFDEEPLAAASIGQVHRARLHGGQEVVVKVQYPGVAAAIESDLRASQGLAFMVSAINHNIDAQGVVDEVKERLFEELDYGKELRNQQLFHALWRGHPLIRVPRVYPELSSARVITQEYCAGLGFTEFAQSATAEEKRRCVFAINDFVFDSMFRHCVFNADPHPGNYILQSDGGVVFLDYGCVKFFRPEFIRDLQALNRSLLHDDRASFETLLKKMEVVLPGKPYELEELWAFFCYHTAPFRVDQEFAFTKEWVREAFAVMDPTKQTRINLPKDFVFLNRITFGLNSIMLSLEGRENFHRLHRRYDYPEENQPPALARLGVDLPARFLPAGMEPAAGATLTAESAARPAPSTESPSSRSGY